MTARWTGAACSPSGWSQRGPLGRTTTSSNPRPRRSCATRRWYVVGGSKLPVKTATLRVGTAILTLAAGCEFGTILISAPSTLPPESTGGLRPSARHACQDAAHAANRIRHRLASPSVAGSGRRREGRRVLREQDPAGARRALLQVPLGRQ